MVIEKNKLIDKKIYQFFLHYGVFKDIICVEVYYNMEDSKIMNPEIENIEEENIEKTLRPQFLSEYIGQTKVKENMKIYIEAAKKRKEALEIIQTFSKKYEF